MLGQSRTSSRRFARKLWREGSDKDEVEGLLKKVDGLMEQFRVRYMCLPSQRPTHGMIDHWGHPQRLSARNDNRKNQVFATGDDRETESAADKSAAADFFGGRRYV